MKRSIKNIFFSNGGEMTRPYDELRRYVAEAMEIAHRIGPRIGADKRALALVRDAMRRDPDPDIRRRAAKILSSSNLGGR